MPVGVLPASGRIGNRPFGYAFGPLDVSAAALATASVRLATVRRSEVIMPMRGLWRSCVTLTSEMLKAFASDRTGRVRFLGEQNLRGFRDAIARVDGVVHRAIADVPAGMRRKNVLVSHPLSGTAGQPRGLIFSAAHSDVIAQITDCVGRLRRVEVTRNPRVPANGRVMRWRDTPWWQELGLDDPVVAVYHEARRGTDSPLILLPVREGDRVVYRALDPYLFGRDHLGPALRGTLNGRPLAMLPLDSSRFARPAGFDAAADRIVLGLREAGLPSGTNVWAARAGGVPISVPEGVPGLEQKTWFALRTDNLDEVLFIRRTV